MSKAKIIALCSTLFTALYSQGWATEMPDAYTIPRSQVLTVSSTASGRAYDLYIKLPPGYNLKRNAGRSYPVVYLNDGTYCFQTAAGVTHMPMNIGGFEHLILVGISYARDESPLASRSRDLTPTQLGTGEVGHGRKYEHGGARGYLNFLRDDVLPFIENRYRANPDRRTLVGQSYGGLFGAYALFAEPGLFHDYILTSPSLWFGNKTLFRMEERFAKTHNRLAARVYFSTGEKEFPQPGKKARFDMVRDQQRFVMQLRRRGYKALEIKSDIIESATQAYAKRLAGHAYALKRVSE